MSDIAKIILWLIIAILVILASIIKLKLNPVIGLIFGSLIMGIGCNLGLVETVSNIGTGFGNLLAGIGLPDRKSTRLNSSHNLRSRMPSSA